MENYAVDATLPFGHIVMGVLVICLIFIELQPVEVNAKAHPMVAATQPRSCFRAGPAPSPVPPCEKCKALEQMHVATEGDLEATKMQLEECKLSMLLLGQIILSVYMYSI